MLVQENELGSILDTDGFSVNAEAFCNNFAGRRGREKYHPTQTVRAQL